MVVVVLLPAAEEDALNIVDALAVVNISSSTKMGIRRRVGIIIIGRNS